MKFLIPFLIAAPLGSAALIRFFVHESERIVAKIATITKLMLVFSSIAAFALWIYQGAEPVEIGFGEVVRVNQYRFPLIFYLDSVSFTFLLVIALISAVIIRYCRYYLHREAGYARFFMTIFLFVSGMNLIVTAGTLDLLFAGWEIVGISSFLLIAFYRERALPVRNAFRAYVVYRICDLGLLLAAYLADRNLNGAHFSVLSHMTRAGALSAGSLPLLAFCFLVLLAASGKSAQFPFCYWLPRAMEGPTPSSAIFYGALSIHAGVFLLIRTFPLWNLFLPARVAVGTVGMLSAIVSTLSGRAQSNIKGQLAYASITQVGLMLVELALGFPTLALVHATANAFLKCYQLLVSPSVVAHLLRIQGAARRGVSISDWSIERWLPNRWRSTLYVFALNEGYLEQALHFAVLGPIKLAAKTSHRFLAGGGWLLAVGLLFAREDWRMGLAAFLAILFSLSAAQERESPVRAWNFVALSSCLIGLSTLFPEGRLGEFLLYFSGVLPGFALGRICLSRLDRGATPAVSRAFLVSILAVSAFPITPMFFGEDILFQHCEGKFIGMAASVAILFVLNDLTLIRLYARLCFGRRIERTSPADPVLRVIGVPVEPSHWERGALP